MNPGLAGRQTLSYVVLVLLASLVAALLLPASPAAPIVTAFLPVGALLALSLVWGRSGASIPLAYVAGEGGLVTATAFTLTAVLVTILARRKVWQPGGQQPLYRRDQAIQAQDLAPSDTSGARPVGSTNPPVTGKGDCATTRR